MEKYLCYVVGTTTYGIMYSSSSYFKLYGFTDSGFARNLDDKKNTSRYILDLGSGFVAWSSKKQPIVRISLVEVEYVATNSTTWQSVWMQIVLSALQQNQEEPTKILL